MAYRQKEKVELGIWQIFAFLVNPAFWAGVGEVGMATLSAAASNTPKSVGGNVTRPEGSVGLLFTQQVNVQKQIDEILAKSRAEREALVAEEAAKKLVTWQKALLGVLIIVGGIVIWKKVKKRKAK